MQRAVGQIIDIPPQGGDFRSFLPGHGSLAFGGVRLGFLPRQGSTAFRGPEHHDDVGFFPEQSSTAFRGAHHHDDSGFLPGQSSTGSSWRRGNGDVYSHAVVSEGWQVAAPGEGPQVQPLRTARRTAAAWIFRHRTYASSLASFSRPTSLQTSAGLRTTTSSTLKSGVEEEEEVADG